MINYNDERKKFVQQIKKMLSGEKLPLDIDGSEILVEPNPFNRYTTAILYPAGIDEENEENDDADAGSSTNFSRSYQRPSSVGFSFYVDSVLNSINISYNASIFKYINPSESGFSDNRSWKWKKIYLGEKGIDEGNNNGISIEKNSTHYIYGGIAKVDILIRKHKQGKIITVTLSNTAKNTIKSDSFLDQLRAEVENSLFEVQLMCHFNKSSLRNYPRVNKSLLSEEEKELELRYKDQIVYAIGHGAAVDWKDINNNEIIMHSDFMPVFEVPQVTANTSDILNKVLDFDFLETIQSNNKVFDQLSEFIDKYEDWIETQEELRDKEDPDDQIIAQNIINRMHIAKKRMRNSLYTLKNDDKAQYAFALANRAMVSQMKRNRPNLLKYSWRPFQLAFFLIALESTINEDDEYRDLVDLIWFPTGGGKTEAYLGIMTFLFVYRRLKYTSSGNGTAAIMRYTLRLLTSQQFIRACKVIGELELIRKKEPLLGNEPFSVGLWLGGGSSPNSFSDAKEAKEKHNFSKFILQECPCCSEKFTEKNYIVTEDSFHFICTNNNCEFGKNEEILPFNVVDEDLYKNPPTLLISTVDKFARIPWMSEPNSFFGGRINRPPELIIQDELHLISGALGSIVGIYEVGLETIITSKGVYPKFIASTATIRQASEQVRALFGREMSVFPPVGLRQSDSYFAKEVPLSEKPGRLYVGYLAFNRQQKNCLSDLSGALLAAPQILYPTQDELKDAWWTQLVYHGSLKGVSTSQTNFQNSIPNIQKRFLINHFVSKALNDQIANLETLERIYNKKYDEFISGTWNVKEYDLEEHKLISLRDLYHQYFPIRQINTKSLKGDNLAEINNQVFQSLSSKFDCEDSIDAVLATNIVSVGLDEPRLALMVINGQPLTTAEYIQASSRVGRGNIPGIVFINYYKNQARSLSHYENFKAYHSSFYRFVEPSSLTPFTDQVRNRALHAALVTAIRHGDNGLLKNTDAEKFLMDDAYTIFINAIIKKFKQRIKAAVPDLISDINEHVDMLIEQWKIEASSAINLRYIRDDKAAKSLLVSFDDDKNNGVWQTLNSMRNIEKNALVKVELDENKFVLNDKSLTPVRFSHITSNSGVESIIYDSMGWLVKVANTKKWAHPANFVELHAVERVKHYFQTEKKLLLPPEAKVEVNSTLKIKGVPIPVDIFPSWMYCTHCGLLYYKPWEKQINNKTAFNDQFLYCNSESCKNPKNILKQVIWCVASENGDIRDVPWHYICHSGSGKKCVIENDRTYLKIKDKQGKKHVFCTKCKASTTFEKFQFKSKSGDKYEIIDVNDARIYTPHRERALVIPPESNIDRNSITYKLLTNSQVISRIKNVTTEISKRREISRAIRELDLKCTGEQLLDAIELLQEYKREEFITTTMLDDEYIALTTTADFPAGADFVTRHVTNEWQKFLNNDISDSDDELGCKNLIDKVVAVDRLRVIEVFRGFSRMDGESREDEHIIPPDLDGTSDWLPSIELFGEGIFFTLNCNLLKHWESNQYVKLRANEIDQRYQESDVILPDEVAPTPRFIMMHTLAHLLIRELEMIGGYPAASLQERIYCSTNDENMAGIMIYTAVPDIAGTLGGISELVEPRKFLQLLTNALQRAFWCSLDPVCGEVEKQGPYSLNRAACHACSLIPETSCSYKNVLLDRVFIKGNKAANIPSLIDMIKEK